MGGLYVGKEDLEYMNEFHKPLFKYVELKDWYGKSGKYEVIRVKYFSHNLFSCTFKNSAGDIEKNLVNRIQLTD